VIGPLGFEGTVQHIAGKDAEVSVNGKRMRVKVADLQVLKGGPAPSKVNVQLHTRDDMPVVSELHLVGRNVDDAISLTDKFLDDAVLSGQRMLRVIHGHGKGQLRKAIAGYLQDHPLVDRFGPAPVEQGGQGVTIVEMKE
jgi:DNA mismatch repair protein MutS2